MSVISLPASRGNVLADTLLRRRGVATDLALVLTGVAVVAVLAQVSIPLWPVPITGQTLGVILVAANLGARRGATSLGLYLLLGVAGLPIFANLTGGPHSIGKPSFGFIIGFVAAAYAIGWLAEREWDKNFIKATVGFAAASLIPFMIGIPYLALVLGTMGLDNSFGTVMVAGFYPFLLGGLIKALIAAMLLPAVWKSVRRFGSE